MARGKSVAKQLLDFSKAALFAGIEIHNKPLIAYRYPTASILFINAWELALKAYVYKFIGKKMIYESDGIHTKGFLNVLVNAKDHINQQERNNKFQAVFDNLNLLNDYRNLNVHFAGGKLDPVIFMLMSKAVTNYDEFIKKYFRKDITRDDNLIILPIGFRLPLDPIDYLKQDYGRAHNDFVNRILQSIRELNNKGIQECILIGFDVYATRVGNIKNADIIAALDKTPHAIALRKAVRITDDPNAPVVRVEPDLPPLTYKDLQSKIKEKKPDIKFGGVFYKALKTTKNNRSLCQFNYLDPLSKKGAIKYFYTEAAVDAIIDEYNRLEKMS